MAASVRFVLTGKPRGKKSPSVTRNGTFIPGQSRSEMDALRTVARIAMAGHDPFDGPVHVKIAAYFEVPKSWPRWKREAALAGEILPTVAPDAGNIIKLVEDAIHAPPQQRAGNKARASLSPAVQRSLRQVCIWDDKQIARLQIWKIYDANPRVVVEVSEMPTTRPR